MAVVIPSRILVTGASGFIGLNLCLELQRLSLTAIPCDRCSPRVPLQGFHAVDLLDRTGLAAIVRSTNPDVVIHLGARTDLDGHHDSDYTPNTAGLSNLVDALLSLQQPPRLLAASSRLVFRIGVQPRGPWDYSPSTAYGRSKVAGEKILRQIDPRRLPWVIVRPTSIWGPWFGVPYRNFFDAVLSRRYLHPNARQIRKSFGFVGNTVHQLLALMRAPDAAVLGRAFFLADPVPIEVGSFADAIAAAAGTQRPHRVPTTLLRCAAWSGDLLRACRALRNPPLTSFRLDNLLTDMVYDVTPTIEVTGQVPFEQAHGIATTLTWLRCSETAPT